MRPAKAKTRRTHVVFSGAALIALVSAVIAWPFVVDDAFITFRYARHLVDGEGYVMNPGTVTDGVTGPLWLVPLVLGGAAGASIPALAGLMGLVFALASAVLLLWSMSGRSGGYAREVSAVFLALSGAYWVWAGAGLETGAATFVMTVLVASVVRPLPRWAPLLALVALPSLRPELVPAACLLGLHARRLPRLWSLSALSAGVASIALWRGWMFGTPIPLSAVAKGGSFANGVMYGLSGALLMSVGGGAYLAWRARKRRAGRWVAGALLLHVVVVVVAGGDWMPGHRLLVPLVPALALLVGWGCTAYRRAALVLTPTFALAAALSVFTLAQARDAGLQRQVRGHAVAASIAEGPVALLDAGFLSWETDFEVVDLGGITDPMVARMPGNHVDRFVDVAYLEARRPATFVLHSLSQPTIAEGSVSNFRGYPTENRLVRLPWFTRSYEPVEVHRYSTGYWYVRFERRD